MVALLLLWFLLDRPMSCPRCGDVCHCELEFRLSATCNRLARPRFELSGDGERSTVLVDPDPYDASEEQFSASLTQDRTARPKFVLDGEDSVEREEPSRNQPAPAQDRGTASQPSTPQLEERQEFVAGETVALKPPESKPVDGAARCTGSAHLTARTSGTDAQPGSGEPAGSCAMDESPAPPRSEPSNWKDEVAARLDSYRARRKPRPPRYPSLRLKFEASEPRSNSYPAPTDPPAPPPIDSPAITRDSRALLPEPTPRPQRIHIPLAETGRIIEFPRSYYIPPARPANELAEPVVDQPRILDVPEIAPPPPALGGILLPPEEREPEKRPGFEIPLQTPPMSQRACAMAIDAMIVLSACALFGYIGFTIGGAINLSPTVMETAAVVLAIFWSGYQYLLLIYTGSTPGLRLAHLQLSQFDGSPVPRRMRRWRVLASILSAVSLGLGFAWSYLDEDALCWHDRITRTYLAPKR